MGIMKRRSSPPPSPTAACANLRTAYHNCFNRWYSEKYVKGQWDKEECVSEWQKYKACLSEHLEEKHLSRFLEAQGPPFNSTIGADSTTESKTDTGPN